MAGRKGNALKLTIPKECNDITSAMEIFRRFVEERCNGYPSLSGNMNVYFSLKNDESSFPGNDSAYVFEKGEFTEKDTLLVSRSSKKVLDDLILFLEDKVSHRTAYSRLSHASRMLDTARKRNYGTVGEWQKRAEAAAEVLEKERKREGYYRDILSALRSGKYRRYDTVRGTKAGVVFVIRAGDMLVAYRRMPAFTEPVLCSVDKEWKPSDNDFVFPD